MLRSTLLSLLLLLSAMAYGQPYTLQYIDTKTNASFRGLCVADQHAVWVSGSKGWVGRSANGGKDWTFKQAPGYETLDFRTLYAFDSNTAIIANAGSPAYILRTTNGGATWNKVYENTDTAAFIDGIDFWNQKKRGLIHGDPIDGHMLLLRTRDGGKTWKAPKKSPKMAPGEASFAASGTAINCFAGRKTLIAIGGRTSKLLYSRSRGRRWRSIPTPMLATSSSTGIFSIMTDPTIISWLIAGGDYKQDTLSTANFFYTLDKGKTWHAPQTTTRGYRECLAMIEEHPVKQGRTKTLAVGPSGIDISADMGATWKPLSDEKGFHVIKRSKDHKLMFLAGANGKLAVMQVQ